MKKTILAIIFACCTLALAAQEGIPVSYHGANPTISDFAWAFLSSSVDDEEECCIDEATNAVRQAWINHREGIPQYEGQSLTIDEKNGYAVYESQYEEHLVRIEMCYWNESDRKHKLFAYNVSSFFEGKYSPGQFDGIMFYRYDNATKRMIQCDDTGFDVVYTTEDGGWLSFALPQTGKDIIVTTWHDNGTKQKTLKWNGSRFSW